MFREKRFLLLFLSLVYYVKAVEIYNEGQSSEPSWFRDWRKPIAERPDSNNQITNFNTTPGLAKDQEVSSTAAPKLAIKKTNSYIVGPWGTSDLEPRSTPALIQEIINVPTSPAPPPITVRSEEPVVEIKPRRRTFNFGSPEAAPSQTETKWIPTYSSHGTSEGLEPKLPSTTPPIIKEEKPSLEIKPIHRSLNFEPKVAAPGQTKWIPTYALQVPSETSESKPLSTNSVVIKEEKPSFGMTPSHRFFNFDSTKPSYIQEEPPKSSPRPISSTTAEANIESQSPPTTFVTVSNTPSTTEKYLPDATSSTANLEIEHSFRANELSLATTPAQIQKSPGFIVYRYEEPIISTTLSPPEGVEYLSAPSLQQEYKCDVKNGFYEVVSNCDKFVECKDNVLKLYKCSNGLHFNRNAVWPSDPCDEPSRVKCSINEMEHELQPQPQPKPKPAPKSSAILISSRIDYMCPSYNGYYRLENDCEKFIKCENNLPSSYKCSTGLKFNSYAAWGQDPCSADVQCKTVIVRPEPERKFSAILVMELPNYSCPSNEGYFISENDCEQFIKCEKSLASLYKCAPGLQFNRYASWIHDPCEKESVVRCKAVVVHPPLPELKMSAALILARISDYSCPAANGYHRFENDCEKFIKCENSIASSYKCNPGLQFNRYALWGSDPCANSEIVRCKMVIIHPNLEPTISAVLIGREYNFSCPANEGYYSTDSDCDQFFMCKDSKASLYKCSDGLQFNRYALWGQDPCASEKVVRCQAIVLQPRPVPKFSAELIIKQFADYKCPSSEGYFSLENECDKFVKCEKSIPSSYKCWPGLQFNGDTAWGEDPCASESIVGCIAIVIEPKPTLPPPKFSANLVSRIVLDFVCPTNNGYFNSKTECEKFIKCENAVASLYKCIPGMQFNRNSAWGEDPCASEAVVRCQPVVDPPPKPKFSADLVLRHYWAYVCESNDGYFKLGNDCNKFVKCENSQASSYKCWSGLQFNPQATLEQDPCASESIVGCKAIVIEPKPTRPSPKFSANLVSKIVFDFVCPKNNGYFNSKNECEQFIKCENAVASLYKCLPGMQFNRNSVWGEDPCASETVVRCQPVVVPLPKPEFSADLILKHMWAYNCNSNNGYYKLGDDCDKFVKCENSLASSYKCWSGLQFNPQVAWGQNPCASESIVGCKAVNIPPTTPKPKFSAILIASHIEDYRCTEADGYFGLDNNCERFVECKMFVPSLYTCRDGLQFNRRARFGEDPCASASVVLCQIGTTTKSTTTTTTTTTLAPVLSYTLLMRQVFGYTCSAANGYYSVKNECEQFVECKNYVPSLYRCNSGLHFNKNVMWGADPCAIPSIARCESALKRPPGPIEHEKFECPAKDGLYPLDNFECSKYMMCQRGKAIIMPCPPGLVFNAELQACDWPVNVPSCNPDMFHGFTCPAPETDEEGKPSDRIVKFKYEDSCSQYIACQQGRPRLLSCDKGLSFSEEFQACVSAEKVASCRR